MALITKPFNYGQQNHALRFNIGCLALHWLALGVQSDFSPRRIGAVFSITVFDDQWPKVCIFRLLLCIRNAPPCNLIIYKQYNGLIIVYGILAELHPFFKAIILIAINYSLVICSLEGSHFVILRPFFHTFSTWPDWMLKTSTVYTVRSVYGLQLCKLWTSMCHVMSLTFKTWAGIPHFSVGL